MNKNTLITYNFLSFFVLVEHSMYISAGHLKWDDVRELVDIPVRKSIWTSQWQSVNESVYYSIIKLNEK